jgi:NCS1 family nucleobase:cation symporter-1
LAAPAYGSSVGTVEPFALDSIDHLERHGTPRDLFALWFGANAETANFAVGILAVALYGASFRGAILGLVIGSICGCAGARFGLPQMVYSRRVFGWDGNALPAVFAFLAGVGWFSIDTIFGAQALASLVHISYGFALVLLLVVQITIAVYGYNAIHAFERVAGIASLLGFGTIAAVVLSHWHGTTGFDVHAPLASGGETGAIAFSASIALAYSIGWAPSASDYSRYLPAASSPRAIVGYAFAGGFIPSTLLMILGAAAATIVRGPGIASGTPADTMTLVSGGNATIAAVGLITVLIGTLSGNVMNLYSGALSGLVAYDPERRLGFAALTAGALALLTVGFLVLAGASDPTARFAPAVIALAAAAVALLTFVAVRWTLVRWQAALAVGALGGALALVGSDATATAHIYGNFLGLLSTWAAPWAGAVLAARHVDPKRIGRAGLIALAAGIVAGVPFWQQSWFIGPVAAAHPQLGDLSYVVSFFVAFGVTRALRG